VIAYLPEHNEYLNPKPAIERFKDFPRLTLIPVSGARHLWVGEPFAYFAAS